MAHDKRRGQQPIRHQDRRRDTHDYAREEWRLRRDKLLTFFACGLLAVCAGALVAGLGEPVIVGGLAAGAFGLLGGPAVLRRDEQSWERDRD